MSVLTKCSAFTSARDAAASGYYPYFVAFEESDGTVARLDGREIVMAGSNNYLGLTRDPRVVAAAHAALDRYGSSCTGSRLLNGNLRLHEQLEEELADYFDKPAALVYSTGYGANVGTISGLLTRNDHVLLDREAHASAMEGALASHADLKTFGHNRADDLARRLDRLPDSGGRLVVVDGVYSMGGDLAPLPEMLAVCQRFGAQLLVDDAHGVGVTGGGLGTCAEFGVTAVVDLITVTFSKSLASIGGAVMADEDVIHYLRHHARAEIFSASMTPASTAAALTALRIARDEPWRGRQALDNARSVRTRLRSLGYSVGDSSSPIVPVHLHNEIETALLWRRLLDLGVYTNAVVPPAGSCRLRLSFSAGHTSAQLDRVVRAFADSADLLPGSGGTVVPLGQAVEPAA